MKNLKTKIAALSFVLGGLGAQAQNYSIDISTGLDAYGITKSPTLMDDFWTVLRPGQGYSPVMIGTGFDESSTLYTTWTGNCYDVLGIDANNAPHARILVPYPYESQQVGGNCGNYTNTTVAPNHQVTVGDIRHSTSLHHPYCNPAWTEPVGRYYFRRKVNIDVPPCQQFTSAHIRVKVLGGLDNVDQIFINGHPRTVSVYNPVTANANLYTAANAGATQEYNIPVDPSWLIPGGQNTIVITVNKSNNMSGTGLMFYGWLEYTLGSGGGIGATFTGTTPTACPGSPAQIQVQVTNSGSNTYTAFLLGQSTPGGPYSFIPSTPYPNPSLPFSQQTTFNIPSVGHLHYKVQLASSNPSCYSVEYLVPMSTCNSSASVFVSTIMYTGNHFVVQADPMNPDEMSLADFKQKWKLEDLDPASLEPLYVIDDPECWRLGAGEVARFNGFDPANGNYEADYLANGNIDIDCESGQGLFQPHHVYRLTRSVKSNGTDWEDYSAIVRPGTDATFTYNLTPAGSGRYNLEASPVDEAAEMRVEGFEQKWRLEKLEPSNLEPMYVIEANCWSDAAGTTNTFPGFDPTSHDYMTEYSSGPVAISCGDLENGLFEEGTKYRLTRYVKGELYDWAQHSEIFTPGSFARSSAIDAAEASGMDSRLSIYPNPGTGRFVVNTDAKGTMKVCDALGKVVLEIKLSHELSQYTIDLSGFAKGIYTVKISGDEQFCTKKLILE